MFCILILLSNAHWAQAQLTVSYESFPSSMMSDPDTEPVNGQRNFTQDLKLQVSSLNIGIGFPFVFSEGKTVYVPQINYQHLNIIYENWDLQQGGTSRVDNAYAIDFSSTLIHQVNEKWSLLAILTPGIASDFVDDLQVEDFTIQAVFVFIKEYRETFSAGYGLAYSNTFGQPFPVPVIAINWNNGANLRIESILPVNMEVTYKLRENMETGLLLNVAGNQYHGAESKFDVGNPLMRYSSGVIGPFFRLATPFGFKATITGGYTFLRRFEFFDGDTEAASYNIKNKAFIRVGLQLGG
ncbi:DUF6268 family outer membrane beta-barrel protein [candidate division KSB1 bacterium]